MFSERNNGYFNIKITPFDKGKFNLNFDIYNFERYMQKHFVLPFKKCHFSCKNRVSTNNAATLKQEINSLFFEISVACN